VAPFRAQGVEQHERAPHDTHEVVYGVCSSVRPKVSCGVGLCLRTRGHTRWETRAEGTCHAVIDREAQDVKQCINAVGW